MAVYTFVNGVRKRIFSHKPVVYVNGVKHTIGKCYTFVNGERKKIFDTWSLKHEELFTSNATVELPFGTYQAIIRGAGGAGGKSVGSKDGFVGGVGGCGGKGSLVSETIVLSDTATADVMIGAGGKTYDNGGNGGKGGAAGRGEGLASGAGGGGGMPSVLLFSPSSTTIQYYGWESSTSYTTPYYAWKYTTRFTATVNSRQYNFERYPSKDEIVSNNKRYYWRGEPVLGSEIEYGYTNTLNVLDGSLIYIDGGSVSGQRVRSVVQGTAIYTKTTSLSAGMAIYNSSFQQIGTTSAVAKDYELTYNSNSYSRDNNSDITQTQTLTKVMLTQSYPASEDDYVYNTDLDVIGTVMSATSTTVVYDGDTYTRYSDIDTTQEVQESAQVYYADGGGGGGGGGAGGTANRRYDTGGPGGAGGGLYKVEIVNDAVEIISLAGKDGTNGAAYSTRGANGTAGLGDPDIYSGAGGAGNFGGDAGGSQAFGGGASGAGGGGGPGNFNTSAGGAGGGGAGGCKDAGGGGNAYSPNYSQFNSNVVSYNAGKTTPTDTLAENITYGVNSNYGVGGTTNTDGAQGFILIKRVA